jgi:hypothetical protein
MATGTTVAPPETGVTVAGALGGIVPFIGFIVSIRGFNGYFRTIGSKYQFDLFFQSSILNNQGNRSMDGRLTFTARYYYHCIGLNSYIL